MTIRLRKFSILIVTLGLIGLLWLLLPVYGFLAYRGGAPLPPFGWNTMLQSAPVVQELHNPIYEKNGEKALQAIASHQETINVPAISAGNANHGAVSQGSRCWLLVFPDYDMAVAVATNTNTEEFAEFGGIWRDLFTAFASADTPGI